MRTSISIQELKNTLCNQIIIKNNEELKRRAGDKAQIVVYLPSKYEDLSSNSSTNTHTHTSKG
jgi:hypothetical protein